MPRRAGIIGHPVAHSLSPVFQQAAFAKAGLDVTYELWDTTLENLAAQVEALRADDVLGANVTIPHKEAVVRLLDELGGQSAAVGAVNTIVNRGGRLHGYNTDGPGFVAALNEHLDFMPEGKDILLLGAGGAARGIAFALVQGQARSLAIWNRTTSRAERLAADVVTATDGQITASPDVSALARYDCIVNCTSVGMDGTGTEAETPCDLTSARPDAVAVDIVYKPALTTFLRNAQEQGMRTLSGLPMLIHQGALAFEHWTGLSAPIDTMTGAAEAAIAAEGGSQ